MKRFALMIAPLPLLAFVDLGTMGSTHAVTEPDMMAQFRAGLSKVTPEKVRRKAMRSIERAKSVSANIPGCIQERHIAREYLYTFQRDLKAYDGTILYQAGQTVPVNTKVKKSMCIVDGRTPQALEASIAAVTQKGRCDKTMIAGGSLDLIQGRSELGGTYPYQAMLSDALHATCYPVRIELEGNEIRYDEFGVAQ